MIFRGAANGGVGKRKSVTEHEAMLMSWAMTVWSVVWDVSSCDASAEKSAFCTSENQMTDRSMTQLHNVEQSVRTAIYSFGRGMHGVPSHSRPVTTSGKLNWTAVREPGSRIGLMKSVMTAT